MAQIIIVLETEGFDPTLTDPQSVVEEITGGEVVVGESFDVILDAEYGVVTVTKAEWA